MRPAKSPLLLLRVEVDQPEALSGDEAGDRAGAVDGEGEGCVRPENEARRVNDASPLVEESRKDG